MKIADSITEKLYALASPERAALVARFFKTGRGEYGEGDKFLGVAVPVCRKIVQPYRKTATRKTISTLLLSPWHEIRFCGIILLVEKSKRSTTPEEREMWANFYIKNSAAINNWDLVDVSAPQVLGSVFCDNPKILFQLANSINLWSQRMSIIATLFDIRRGRFNLTISLAKQFLNHPHDLMHKATGWMLREVGKRDKSILCNFLEENISKIPRTALRYAIEKFSPEQRKYFLSLDSSKKSQ